VIQSSEIGTRHPLRTWTPPDPRALLVCADGEGLAAWVSVIAAAEEPVAVVGIESAGLSYRVGDENRDYDSSADPRARAYLRDVDPPYFGLHRDYVLEAVIPWAEAQFGRLPRLAFGVSNGAAWATAMGAIHPGAFDGVLAFSLGMPPSRPLSRGSALPHALVAGQLEPGFHEATRRYAWRLRAREIPVRLRRPVRGHDLSMWQDELVPALRWVLQRCNSSAPSQADR
jgi:enterochelin esterase-like enzyme